MEELEVDLVGEEVVLGCALVCFQEGVVGSIPLNLSFPLRLFVHIYFFGVEEAIQVFFLDFLEFRVDFFAAISDFGKPLFSFFFGGLNIVGLAVVISIDLVFEEVREPVLSMLVVPQVAQSFQIHLNIISQRVNLPI